MNPENISVLIVDDEESIVEQLVFFFNTLGYSTTGLNDPEEALELLHKQAFDIIMTDLKMPRISGMDLIQAIKLLHYDSKIIIFTGYATTDSAIEALKQGVYSYILKPYDLQELRTTVENAATQLYLQRENIILNQKIKTMFEYMSTLYDIVSILYQVSDFDLTMEMILDTLKEGIKVEKAFISLLNEENTLYAIHSASGLPDQFKNDFVFAIGDNSDG
jgi:DNA-binding NtrC family response regulator